LMNALELPANGLVVVAGMKTEDPDHVWEIRRLCGMVFQNPDNQIVGTTVEEDVAFGPENLGMPQAAIRQAVDQALARVQLTDLADQPPHLLSGGQKQKLAIAGILAMNPACLILDEATSMLDPISRREFMALVQELVRKEGLTVVNITHHMEEVLLADTVHIVSDGRIVASGTPDEVFDQVDLMLAEGLDVPMHRDIAEKLSRRLDLPLKAQEATSWQGAQQAVMRLLAEDHKRPAGSQISLANDQAPASESAPEPVIQLRNLSHIYAPGTAMEQEALTDISFDVYRGEVFGLIGHSGSGKSTLIQHLNGLIRAQSGQVSVLGLDATTNADIRKIRRQVGLLFQYPEHQLFEETVFQDIAFGPRRLGLDMPEIERRVLRAAQLVGLSDQELERSPFELSGGQKRRAAIAGVLAMEPQVLILDEPAAGLDPAGRDSILNDMIQMRQTGTTIVLVSHSMEDIARLSDRILVLSEGRVHAYGRPAEVFSGAVDLEQAGLFLPRSIAFLKDLSDRLPGLDCQAYDAVQAVDHLLAQDQAARPEQGR
ncbi:MAG: energy-coupling factor transporter ATPase, partial [Actinobacteria bacterium]|nr:energy-coupling factor transporter ATPase [Actinomycetota bacterium]